LTSNLDPQISNSQVAGIIGSTTTLAKDKFFRAMEQSPDSQSKARRFPNNDIPNDFEHIEKR
jgi:hypothetical protein